MTARPPTNDQLAIKWIGNQCLLDGHDAIISGRWNKFSSVARYDGKQAIEFSWQAVDRIMRAGGEFKS